MQIIMERNFDNVYSKRFGYFNLHVIKGEDGDVLIDTGFIFMKNKIKRWLSKFNIKMVILTHGHVDHIWNANYIKDLYDCKIAMSEVEVSNINNSKATSQPMKKKYVKWTKLMDFGMKKFNPKDIDVDVLLHNNQIIDKYGLNLKIIDLPGHTIGSIGVLYKNYLFVGDSMVNRKKCPGVAYQNQSNAAAVMSYDKIVNLNPKIVFVGHDREVRLEKLING